MTANSKSIGGHNGYILCCNGCKTKFRWVAGRVGESRGWARLDGWTAASRRKEHGSRLIASNTVKDWCAGCSKESAE